MTFLQPMEPIATVRATIFARPLLQLDPKFIKFSHAND